MSRLGVLVGEVVVRFVLSDIGEMLPDGGDDGDFAGGDAQTAHQVHGVVVGAVCGPESGHRHADDVFARDAERIEGQRGHK